MEVLNRKTAPQIKPVVINNFQNPEKFILENGIPVYSFNAGSQPVVKIDFIFEAGIWHQPKPLIASTVSSMLMEGTKSKTSKQIAEKLDYYGAFLSLNSNNDFTIITLFSLTRFLPKTLLIVEDIVKNAIFPDDELRINLNKRKQSFLIDREKTNQLASRKFLEILFGAQHPYSKVLQAGHYDMVKREMLLEFYKKNYTLRKCKIIASGKLEDNFLDLLRKSFGTNNWGGATTPGIYNYNIQVNKQQKYYIKKEGAVQSAINIGRVLFNRLHPDFMEMKFITILFGGYFGSRLMKNIREDKGYTYGISAQINSFLQSGMMKISTEVKTEVTQNAVKEIYFELDKMKDELVSEDELEKVKSYVMGDLLTVFDGPFSLSDSFRIVNDYNLDFDYYKQYIEKIKNITPARIKELSQKYLDKNDMFEVIAGA
ncbi:MAG: insulinase family protein [Chlorobi bacterium]|nr:insulinase family protein [Chlorobiota bacterium]